MTRPDDQPIRVTPISREVVTVFPWHFLQQETINIRGKSTCYSTSLINAAIASQAVTFEEAQRLHPLINNELISVPHIWDGAFEHIYTLDTRIAEVIEGYIMVRIGIDEPGFGRLVLVERNFEQIQQDLTSRKQIHTIVSRNQQHAYAFVGVRGNELLYVDPLNPERFNLAGESWFNYAFSADKKDQVSTTPVRPRVRVISNS